MSSVIERYQYHQDAGHGWVEVPLDDCVGHRVSPYSYWGYESDGCLVAYLEEDLDAITVLGNQVHYHPVEPFEEQLQYVLEPVQHPGECFVRRLERFPAAASDGFEMRQVYALESSAGRVGSAADWDAAPLRNATQGEPLGGVCSECKGSGLAS